MRIKLLLFLMVSARVLYSQDVFSPWYNVQRFQIGVQYGYTGYHGDLTTDNSKYFTSNKISPPALGVLLKYSLSHTFSLRGAFYSGLLDNNGVNGFSFHNKFKTFELQPVFNLSNLSFMKHDQKWYLYAFSGIGAIKSSLSSSTANPANPAAILYKKWNYSIPVGIGIMYHLSNRMDIGIESGVRFSNTDSLDYYDISSKANRAYDHYSFTTIGLYYKFGRKHQVDHADWIDPTRLMKDSLDRLSQSVQEMQLYLSDKDGDGVPDISDIEPNTPRDVAVDPRGRALDTDHDGIPDYKDIEPYSWPGTQVDTLGKMRDDDKDGVPNGRDKETGTAAGSFVDANGRAIVAPAAASSEGMNDFHRKAIEAILPAIYFEKDADKILPDYIPLMVKIATVLQKFPDIKLDIVGNCDYSYNEEYNRNLGLRRANACRNYLVKTLGCDASRLNVKTNGASKPLVPGNDPNLMLYNRRVNFLVQDQQAEAKDSATPEEKKSGESVKEKENVEPAEPDEKNNKQEVVTPENKKEEVQPETKEEKNTPHEGDGKPAEARHSRTINANHDILRLQKAFEMDSFNAVINGYDDGDPDRMVASADEIIAAYPGTPEAGLAYYYAGAASLRLGAYDAAIDYLKKYYGNDDVVGAMAIGMIGDALVEKGFKNYPEAVTWYEKAAAYKPNSFTTPLYLKKAGGIYVELRDYTKALECFERIKKDYPNSKEAKDIERWQNSKK
jgi:outer membrane protein OmpA-like peptidoglycan-associated protein